MVAGFPYASQPCDGCKQRIRWMLNDHTGKRAPVHTVDRPDGNVVLLDSERYHVLTKAELASLNQPTLMGPSVYADHTRYVLHFVVCPRAAVYRKRDPIARKAHR